MHTLFLAFTMLVPAAAPDDRREPWASKGHPQDAAKRHVEEISAAKKEYRVQQGGTMDGDNCRSPIGGGYGVWEQSWESNRAVRLENVGDTVVVNPWLSNGRNNLRSIKEIVAGACKPGMSERDKALALWRLQTTHRFHAGSGDNEVNDPVKVFNVYGYTTCGNDSICLAGLWRSAGFKVRPAHTVGHCISQVYYDGRWNLLDGDMGPFYLLRDNRTIASEQDLVRDHDLLKRTHAAGILDPDIRTADEIAASLFGYEGQAEGNRDSVRDTTMNMVLRPNEALVWCWGHLVPLKYHGRQDIKVFGPRSDAGKSWGGDAADRICNGRWEYRPDFSKDLWRQGAETAENIKSDGGALVAGAGQTGRIVWRMRSPYVFVGGQLEVEGSGAKFSVSWDGSKWIDVGDTLDPLFQFPHKGDARYDYRLQCELPQGARLKRLAIRNDLQMAPLALPAMRVGDNQFTYTDETRGDRKVRISHEWVERSLYRPPTASAAAVSPTDDGEADGTDIVFQWKAPEVAAGDTIADYHFELSDRADLAWPLSSNFEKLVGNTADRGQARYRVPDAGLLNPGHRYYWHVRAKTDKGVWGPWSRTWSFTPSGPDRPLDVRLETVQGNDGQVVLRWKPGTAGRKPVKYRIYGSDEKGFSVSDQPYKRMVGGSKEVPAQAPANFVAEATNTELVVLGAGLELPNANKTFYRVVAIDEKGKRSGPSDYASAPRPFIFSKPVEKARVGDEYRCQVATVRSLGDLRSRTDGASFFDVEKPRYALVQGPAWLRIDENSGALSGKPDAAGKVDVVVSVTLERSLRRLDDDRLSWGHEKVLSVVSEKTSSTTQRFQIMVEKAVK
jgi:hypothetical protein